MIFTRTKELFEKKDYLIISAGDPAGIGNEIILKALGSKKLPLKMKPLIVGCQKTLEKTFIQLKKKGIKYIEDPQNIRIENLATEEDIIPGFPSAKTGSLSFNWLSHAINLIMKGEGKALVTAPIAKFAWHQAGHKYSGQTELLSKLTGAKTSMLFTAISPYNGWRFNTLLATTHIPYQQVSISLNENLILSKLDHLLDFCNRFKTHPKIHVAGLNPHAGENGNLGIEEINYIKPALHKWQKLNPEIILSGPIPPDSCWITAANAWKGQLNENTPDGILALYHDQGLIPVKLIAFDSAINTTLGLPFIRTSPDHGTAFDIAGKGIAKETSMLAAINEAWSFSMNNKSEF